MLSPFLVISSPIPALHAFMWMDHNSHTHQLRSHCPGIPLHWSIEPSLKQELFLPLMSNKVILYYMCNWSNGSLHVCSFICGLVLGKSQGSGWLILFSFYWVAIPFCSFSPFSNSSISVPKLNPMFSYKHPHLYVRLCLADPIMRHTYQASVIMHLSSAIVSGFGVCIWDVFQGREVSGWLIQSLIDSFSTWFH